LCLVAFAFHTHSSPVCLTAADIMSSLFHVGQARRLTLLQCW
jgi:hypothetical protein